MLAPRTTLWSETVLLKQHNVSREEERERRREKGGKRERERERMVLLLASLITIPRRTT